MPEQLRMVLMSQFFPGNQIREMPVMAIKKGEPVIPPFMLIRQNLLHLVHHSLEGFRMVHGEICKHFTVQFDTLLVHFAHEF